MLISYFSVIKPSNFHLVVLLEIASPLAEDALAVVALERVVAAGGAVAVGLIAPVGAVVVEVASPHLRDALLTVGAHELQREDIMMS